MNWSGFLSFFNFWKDMHKENGIRGFNPYHGHGRNFYPRNHKSKKRAKAIAKNRAGKKARKRSRI